MIGENPIKTNKAKAEDQIIIYYATNAAVAAAVALVSLLTSRAIVGGLPHGLLNRWTDSSFCPEHTWAGRLTLTLTQSL